MVHKILLHSIAQHNVPKFSDHFSKRSSEVCFDYSTDRALFNMSGDCLLAVPSSDNEVKLVNSKLDWNDILAAIFEAK